MVHLMFYFLEWLTGVLRHVFYGMSFIMSISNMIHWTLNLMYYIFEFLLIFLIITFNTYAILVNSIK